MDGLVTKAAIKRSRESCLAFFHCTWAQIEGCAANTELEPAARRIVRGSPLGGLVLFSIDTPMLCRSYLTVFRAV